MEAQPDRSTSRLHAFLRGFSRVAGITGSPLAVDPEQRFEASTDVANQRIELAVQRINEASQRVITEQTEE